MMPEALNLTYKNCRIDILIKSSITVILFTMAAKIIALIGVIGAVNAGYLGAPATYAPGPSVAAAPAFAAVHAAAPAVGVAYSAAPAVSHISYSSPLVTYGAPLATGAITSQHSNILRSYGNLGQVSTYSKTIDTPFSSVSKSDVRVSNPGLKIAAAPVAYAAPALAYSAPAVHAAPVLRAAPVAYSAAPAVSHVSYTGSYGLNYGW